MDLRGFERAVVAFKDRVHAYATRMLRDRAEAQDVAQDALVKLWQHRDTVDEDSARLWLRRVPFHSHPSKTALTDGEAHEQSR